MLDFIVQKKAAILLVVLLVGMLLLMDRGARRAGGATAISGALARSTEPIVRAGSSAAGRVEERWTSLAELRGARERSRRLERELQALRAEKLLWEQEARENERLRRLLGLREVMREETLSARIAGASANEDRTVLIDRGAGDGVRAGLPVVTPSGVLGRVISVSESLAKVLLVTDPASGVSVAHLHARYRGVMVGVGRGRCQLIHTDPKIKVAPGDLLVTSGLDRVYPPGLPAGRVTGVSRGADGSLRIEVRPEATFDETEEVLVVLTPAEAEPVERVP